MPLNRNQMIRLIALDKCFRNRHRQYTFDDLVKTCNDALNEVDVEAVSDRTIRQDMNLMRDPQGFDAPIVSRIFDGRKHIYYYDDPEFCIFKSQIEDEELDAIKNAVKALAPLKGIPQFIHLENSLSSIEKKLKIKSREQSVIGLEQNIDYTAIEHLSGLYQAIVNKQVLAVRYQPFGCEEYDRIIHPYYIKQYNSRWFLFGRDNEHKDRIINMPFDRIIDFKAVNIKYIKCDLDDFEEYFEDIIGVTKQRNQHKCKVVLKFAKERYPYVWTKPLHGSMKRVDEENGIVRIEVEPNKELETLILSYGSQVEVLEPKWLRAEIANKVNELIKIYSDVKLDCTIDK